MKHDDTDEHPVALPAAPSGAAAVFGERMPLAVRFAEILADTGVTHGLIGPREVPRLWDRHVLNCAVVADAFPDGARVVDVGSGAGLPGVALAVVRPDLDVHLVEPMLRRTEWLAGVVADLGLDERDACTAGRAEELVGTVSAPWVTARAVARLDKLARWCVPLLEPGGTLVAMKGRSAATELEEDRRALDRLGLVSAVVSEHGGAVLDEPVLTVDLRFEPKRPASRSVRRRAGGRGADARAVPASEHRRRRSRVLRREHARRHSDEPLGGHPPGTPPPNGLSFHWTATGLGRSRKHTAAVHRAGSLAGSGGGAELDTDHPLTAPPRRWTVAGTRSASAPHRAPRPARRPWLPPQAPPATGRSWSVREDQHSSRATGVSRETCSGVAPASSLVGRPRRAPRACGCSRETWPVWPRVTSASVPASTTLSSGSTPSRMFHVKRRGEGR